MLRINNGKTPRNPNVSEERPNTSLRKVALQTDTSLKSTHRPTKLLQIRSYRISACQELLPTDYPKRIEFCKWLLRLYHDSTDPSDNFFFSDEAWFHLDGYINSQVYRIWSTENPHVYWEVTLHPQKV